MHRRVRAAIRQRWQQKLAAARAAVAAREGTARILIEVAAQHPLVDGVMPGEEFAVRLRDGGFGRLLSIVSVGQMHRKLLHFVEFGVYPFMYTVPTFVIAHEPIHEAMQMIPSVLYHDPDLQGPNSHEAIAFRRARLPGYAAAHGLT